VIPGGEELVPEAFGNSTKILEGTCEPIVILLEEPREGHHLETVGYGPVVADLPTEVDALAEFREGRFRLDQKL
jgi:hypothetical protein